MASAFDGHSVHAWAMACHRGRFRVVVSGPASWSEDSATDPALYVKYMLEVDPTTASLIAPPRYLNGVGRGGVERLTIYSLLGFREDGERLFYAGSPPPYPELDAFFSVGEYDLDWDGVWDDDWHSWARWINMDGNGYEHLLSRWAAPLGDRIVYAWADWLNGYTTGRLAVGPQPEGMVDLFEYDRTVSIEDLMQATPMPRNGFLEVAVGTRTIAAACDEWMLVFDHDLERIGRPVNFSSLASGSFHYRVVYGGGYYAVIHSGIAPDPGSPYEVSADFAISLVNEDAEFIDRKVMLCPTDGLPNTLPNYHSYLMDAYWNGEGFWMVFATQPVFPGPWELRVLFLPVP
jgi:hypothetical protein